MDLRERETGQSSSLFVDEIDKLDVSKFPIEPADRERTIWEANQSVSASDVDIGTLRDEQTP